MRVQTILFTSVISLFSLGALALPVTYKFEVDATFTVKNASGETVIYGDAQNDNGELFTVTMSGDTDNVNNSLFGAGTPSIGNLTALFSTSGFSANLSESVYVFSNHVADIVGFGNNIEKDLINILHEELTNYDLKSNISFEEFSPYVGAPSSDGIQWIDVDYQGGGVISMSEVYWVKFTANITEDTGGGNGGGDGGGDGGTIPEPSTLAMLGLGMLGLIASRRKTK